MKYLKLRISNFRGVDEKTIEFEKSGITLVRGPNEIGKTSLGEAIRVLFEYPDNSKNRKILEIKPVHKDVGPEIELEVESGPYRFTYFKRFLKRPETRLIISQPKAENITGRQAHDRVDAILDETLDVNLWRALSINQGNEIRQPELESQTWLSSALDKAAGSPSTDPSTESLYNKVHSNYLVYFTESGTERKDIIQAHQAVEDTKNKVYELEKALQELENEVERVDVLKSEIKGLGEAKVKFDDELTLRAEKIKTITSLEKTKSDAEIQLESALLKEKAAIASMDARNKLISDVSDAKKATDDMKLAEEKAKEALEQIKDSLEQEQASYSEVEKELNDMVSLHRLHSDDVTHLRNILDLALMQERKSRVDEAREQYAQSSKILERNKVDNDALQSIEAAYREVIKASATLGGKAPNVKLKGINTITIFRDDSPVQLSSGEEIQYTIQDKTIFSIEELVELEISPGSSLDTLTKKLEEAKKKLDSICLALGVDNPDKARSAFEEREKALKNITDLDRIEKENLRDLTYDQLNQRIEKLKSDIPEYVSSRNTVVPLPDSLDSAQEELIKKERRLTEIEEKCHKSEIVLAEIKKQHENSKEVYIRAQSSLKHHQNTLKELEVILEVEREKVTDEVINLLTDDEASNVQLSRDALNTITQQLLALNPEQEKELEETAKGSFERVSQLYQQTEKELIQVETSLRISGEKGLSDQLNNALSKYERVNYEYDAISRRSKAVKLLFETMKNEREKTRHRYVAPLKEKIENLGKLVFGSTLQVEVRREDLQIINRTLNNITVDFDSLSGGSKEQLSLIYRLACAMIVAADGGAPLILDDALGYTDPDRLHLMGAVLSKATKECQVVILTCTPDRYANIGSAKEIVLSR